MPTEITPFDFSCWSPYVVFTQWNEFIQGKHIVLRFPNNYGASIIQGKHSYGLEMAVVRFLDTENEKWEITYDTYITNDVLGHLSKEDVYTTLQKIFNLDKI